MTLADRIEDIIPDSEIQRVHGHANFGQMTPREVVNEGVVSVSKGYSNGYTMTQILLEHGLVWRREFSWPRKLKPKGKRYLAAIRARESEGV